MEKEEAAVVRYLESKNWELERMNMEHKWIKIFKNDQWNKCTRHFTWSQLKFVDNVEEDDVDEDDDDDDHDNDDAAKTEGAALDNGKKGVGGANEDGRGGRGLPLGFCEGVWKVI